jgi:hypothetical protein
VKTKIICIVAVFCLLIAFAYAINDNSDLIPATASEPTENKLSIKRFSQDEKLTIIKNYQERREQVAGLPLTSEMKKDLKWIKDSSKNTKHVNYFSNRLVYCQENPERWRGEYGFTDHDIDEIKEHCKGNVNYQIRGAKISKNIEDCAIELKYYLSSKINGKIDKDIILKECLLRQYYEQEKHQISDIDRWRIYHEREAQILKSVPENKSPNPFVPGLLKPMDTKRNATNISFPVGSYESVNDLRRKLLERNPVALEKIEEHGYLDEKPRLMLKKTDEEKYEKYYRKSQKIIPWYRK